MRLRSLRTRGTPVMLSPVEPQVRPYVYRTGPPCPTQSRPGRLCGGTRYGRREGASGPWECRRCGTPTTYPVWEAP